MRTLSRAELPENCDNEILIKSGARRRQRRLSNALEMTLRRCREIHAEQNKHTVEMRARSEKEGFSAGFQHFFSMLIDMLEAYESLLYERQAIQHQQLQEAITQALHDPIAVERIVTHLHDYFDSRSELTLILPAGLPVPEAHAHLTCLTTEDEHITLQCGMQALRFPIDTLCQQWITQADKDIQHINQKLNELIPSTLTRIVEQLQQYDQQRIKKDKENKQ